MAAAEIDPAAAVTTDLVTELEQRDIKFRTAVRTENRHSLRPRPPIMAIPTATGKRVGFGVVS